MEEKLCKPTKKGRKKKHEKMASSILADGVKLN